MPIFSSTPRQIQQHHLIRTPPRRQQQKHGDWISISHHEDWSYAVLPTPAPREIKAAIFRIALLGTRG
jgi:hypothetical protein